jgi:hypothetical protein
MSEVLIEGGWDYHDTESERLAVELEAAAAAGSVRAADQVSFLRLAGHVIGEHLSDWPRARRLAERVLDGEAPCAETAKAWAHLSLARLLAGDAVAAAEAELVFLAALGDDFRGGLIELRFMLVAALVSGRRTEEATGLYAAALGLAEALGEAAPHRAIAVASNNLASELVEQQARTEAEDALMLRAAGAAHAAWARCGTWVNEERALYLKALVANALGDPPQALAHADAALALIAANGDQPIDAAFLTLARARAHHLAGDATAAAAELAQADAGAADWDDDDLKDWFAIERAKIFA